MGNIIGAIFWIIVLVVGYNYYDRWQSDKTVASAREKYGDSYHQRQKDAIRGLITTQHSEDSGDYLSMKNTDVIPIECEVKICYRSDCVSRPISISSRDSIERPDLGVRMIEKNNGKTFRVPSGTTYEFIYRDEVIKRIAWQ